MKLSSGKEANVTCVVGFTLAIILWKHMHWRCIQYHRKCILVVWSLCVQEYIRTSIHLYICTISKVIQGDNRWKEGIVLHFCDQLVAKLVDESCTGKVLLNIVRDRFTGRFFHCRLWRISWNLCVWLFSCSAEFRPVLNPSSFLIPNPSACTRIWHWQLRFGLVV